MTVLDKKSRSFSLGDASDYFERNDSSDDIPNWEVDPAMPAYCAARAANSAFVLSRCSALAGVAPEAPATGRPGVARLIEFRDELALSRASSTPIFAYGGEPKEKERSR